MEDEVVSAGGLTEHGSPPRPEGEKASGHAGRAGEVSPVTLANNGLRSTTTTAPKGVNRPVSPAVGTTDITRSIKLTLNIPRGDKEIVPALKRARAMCATASNLIIGDMWLADRTALNAWMKKYGRKPKMGKDGEWKFPHISKDNYKSIRKAVPDLASGIASAISYKVGDKWFKERFEALILEDISPPHFKRTNSIPLRAQDVSLIKTDKGYDLKFSLFSGRGQALTIPLVIKDSWQRSVLSFLSKEKDSLKEGKWKLGEVRIKQDHIHFRKWYAIISYKRRVRPEHDGVLYGAINRGLFRFMVGVTETGKKGYYDAHYVDGNDVAAYLAQMQKRRKEYQYASWSSGRRGHGRKRILEPTDKLSGKATRYKDTYNQTKARAYADKFLAQGVGHVFIEDFSGIRDGEPEKLKVRGSKRQKWVWDRIQEWPFYDFQMRLQSCLDEYGIGHTKVSAHYISQLCPVCGHEDEKNMQLGRRMFKCVNCGWKRDLDVVAAINVMHRGFEELSAKDAKASNNQAVRKKKRRTNRTSRKRGSK